MRIKVRTLLIVIVFAVITGLLSASVGVVMGRIRIQPSSTYRAVFSDASGIKTGVDVRAAGVAIGEVKAIDADPHGVMITFNVPQNVALTQKTSARIRYANLTGDRYLDLTGLTTPAKTLRPGSVIPLSRTQPALDLDQFFAGFDPLMQALDPGEVNKLTSSIIAVTQGQAGSVESLLNNVGSFTSTLAKRDELIGEVVTNLGVALRSVDDQRAQFDHLIVGLAKLTHGLAKDRRTIATSLTSINTLAEDTAGLVGQIRPSLKANIDQIGVVSQRVNDNLPYLNEVLGLFRTVFQRYGRGGSYGSFFNFYLCGVRLRLSPADGIKYYTPFVQSNEARCKFPEDR